ncbi:MAG: ABC transporter permease subunit/CPBP intramembrane protease [Planctomycetota bacterium]
MSEYSKQIRRDAASAGKPRWSAIWLIYVREMKDQLRDRRTLFTIAVLPMLLYPLVGMLLLQIAQFTRQNETTVCIIGHENLPESPPLLVKSEDETRFSSDFGESAESLAVVTHAWDDLGGATEARENAEKWIRSGKFDVVVLAPESFKEAGGKIRGALPEGNASLPNLELMFNVGSDESVVTRGRMSALLTSWRANWINSRLTGVGIDPARLIPFEWTEKNVAPERTREAAFWSKLLPFIMLVWAMTGAFYPAIDLVAGEKERGTLETLLCSPALRSEIVWGKLATVTTFSMSTALLNAGSMLITSTLVFQHLNVGGGIGSVGSPPLVPMLWLLVALVPLSCLFSALALAVAAMARSSKEGQYYLMPLMMVTLPLVMLPMLPGTKLGIGTSLIPVTGMFLLARSLVEGQFGLALSFTPVVFLVTGGCLWFAARWARRQFENESVLFGSGDQWELGMWVRHLWRDRQTAATPAQAYGCGALILVSLFFARLTITEIPDSFSGIAKLVMMPQVLIVFPALAMATMFTTSVRQSLRLRMPHWTTLPIGLLFALAMHPTYVMLSKLVSGLYPISEQAALAMKPFSDQIAAAPWSSTLLLMAVLPAVCEEIAFRGFIFGGLVRDRGRVRAVLVTALMFGISHGVLQQSICASIMGVVLGWITLRTGSLLPCIIIHLTNNALSVSLSRISSSSWEGARLFLTETDAGPAYQPLWTLVGLAIAGTCLLYFGTIDSPIDESESPIASHHGDYTDPTKSLASAS